MTALQHNEKSFNYAAEYKASLVASRTSNNRDHRKSNSSKKKVCFNMALCCHSVQTPLPLASLL